MDLYVDLHPVQDDLSRRCSYISGVHVTTISMSEEMKAKRARRRRQMALAALASAGFIVASLIAVILALHYKIVPLGRSISLHRTRCYITKIDREIVNVSSGASKDDTMLYVAGNDSGRSHTCVWVNVVYEDDSHVLLPGVLMDHPFRRTSTSKCLRGFHQTKQLDAVSSDNILWTPSKAVRVGQKVWCYKHNYKKPIYDVDDIKKGLQRERAAMFSTTIKMILPPTFVFILAFICLFFSCVYWQRES